MRLRGAFELLFAASGDGPTGGPAKGRVRAGFLGRDKLGAAITRADIASFLLDQFDDTRFIRAAPAISN